MFWSKNKDKDKRSGAKKKASNSSVKDPNISQNKSDRLREEAMANARRARESIGEEALDKIAAMMTKKQQSIIEQTKNKVAETEAERVATEILMILDEKQ